jgi:hypothetical protein
LVASPSPRPDAPGVEPARQPGQHRGRAERARRRSLELLQGSLSPQRIERRAPWLANLHRAANATIAGLGISMLALSVLTLYWQNQWGQKYNQLKIVKLLSHRLQESGALLERHHLASTGKSGWLVPTSSEKLIYLPGPVKVEKRTELPQISALQLRQIPPGY